MKKALTISMDMDTFGNSNTGVAKAAKYIATDSVKTDPEFENLFLQDKENIDSIAEKIKAEGFSDAHPLIIWKEKDILVDGHTRLKAARKAGCFQVPVMYESFASREEALKAAMDEQIQRRNLRSESPAGFSAIRTCSHADFFIGDNAGVASSSKNRHADRAARN